MRLAREAFYTARLRNESCPGVRISTSTTTDQGASFGTKDRSFVTMTRSTRVFVSRPRNTRVWDPAESENVRGLSVRGTPAAPPVQARPLPVRRPRAFGRIEDVLGPPVHLHKERVFGRVGRLDPAPDDVGARSRHAETPGAGAGIGGHRAGQLPAEGARVVGARHRGREDRSLGLDAEEVTPPGSGCVCGSESGWGSACGSPGGAVPSGLRGRRVGVRVGVRVRVAEGAGPVGVFVGVFVAVRVGVFVGVFVAVGVVPAGVGVGTPPGEAGIRTKTLNSGPVGSGATTPTGERRKGRSSGAISSRRCRSRS